MVNINKGTYLNIGDFLTIGDYLQSNNKLFFAIMQVDGTLGIYKGRGPGDDYGGIWFSTGSLPNGEYFTIMQVDGTLGIYKGTGPSDNHGGIWFSTGSLPNGKYITYLHNNGQLGIYLNRDPSSDIENDNTGIVWYTKPADPIDHFVIKDVEYDTTKAKISNPIIKNIGTASLINQTDTVQESEKVLTNTLEESSQWSSTVNVKMTVTEKASVGIPEIGEAGIDISMEMGVSFTYGETVTRSKTVSYTVKLSALPQTKLVSVVTIDDSVITIPCKFKGNAILKSGISIPTEIDGEYVGTSAYNTTEVRTSSKLDNSQYNITFKKIKIKA